MQKQRGLVAVLVCIGVLFVFVQTVFAGDEVERLMELLLKKKIITEKEYRELKTEMKGMTQKEDIQAEEGGPVEMQGWKDRISVSGAIEGEFRWQRHRDITDAGSDSSTDLYVRRLELGITASLAKWIEASVVLNSEWIGDDLNAGDEEIAVDEATVTLGDDDFPFYLVAGKRTQPFGVYENHLITDPATQDAYETKRVGLTAGYGGPLGLDVSVTVYKGEEQMNHLFESGLFAESIQRRGDAASDEVSSYIVSTSVTPVDDGFTVFASYLSEPGWGRRNDTIGVGFNLEAPFLENLRIDAEYMKALKREHYEGLNEEFKESVFSISAAYEFVLRKRKVIGGGLFAERKAHMMSEPLEVALRYEHFDDDGLAEATGAWSIKDRYSGGVRYSFYNDETSGLNAFVGVEYRKTRYRTYTPMIDSNDEVYTRLGVGF